MAVSRGKTYIKSKQKIPVDFADVDSQAMFYLYLTVLWGQILDEIEEHSIKIYHLPDAESDEDEDFKEQTRLLKVRTIC